MKSIYTICYFSKVSGNLGEEEIQKLFDYSSQRNNEKGVCGILLHSLGNFFQVLEGDKEYLTQLYETKIKQDPRHHSIFVVINKGDSDPIFTKYNSRFETIENSDQLDQVKTYLEEHSVKSSTSNKLSRLLKSFVILDY